MILRHYSKTHANLMNKLTIPDISEPFPIKIHWFRERSFDKKSSAISPLMHLHTFFEAHFVVSGTMEYASGTGKEYILKEGTGILISPYTDHIVKCYSSNFVSFTLAFVVEDTANFYQNLTQNEIYTFALSDYLINCIDEVLREVELKTTFSQSLIRNRMLDIICAMSRSVGIYEYCETSEMTAEDRRVTAAKLYINDNSDKFLTCIDVANHCGLSPKQMNRIFYAATKKNLHDYINIIRIKKAECLLIDTSMPIKEISEALGFSSVYYFNRFFTRNTGLTPAYFRKIGAK